ncbi:MAG: hypothetical protein Q7P63_03960 [Verrucomicrobiota bacterium JB022]|nr:hypothetical protein [Verrucomicrobiota bacterium JB022]
MLKKARLKYLKFLQEERPRNRRLRSHPLIAQPVPAPGTSRAVLQKAPWTEMVA